MSTRPNLALVFARLQCYDAASWDGPEPVPKLFSLALQVRVEARGKVNKMRNYECTYILDTRIGDDASTAIMERFASVVNDNQGEVRQVKPWGKRRFAYDLKGRREGVYVTMQFAAEPDTMAELRRQMSLSDDVIRSLFLTSN